MKNDTLLIAALIGGVLLLILLTRSQQQSAGYVQAPVSRYQNEETWELVRDDSGRILKVIVHRDAKEV